MKGTECGVSQTANEEDNLVKEGNLRRVSSGCSKLEFLDPSILDSTRRSDDLLLDPVPNRVG